MGEEKNSRTPVALDLDPDEAEHLQSVPEACARLLVMANEGAIISMELAAHACQGIDATSRQALLAMLTLKAADHLRLAATGLLMGYYNSAPVLLRTALDCIGILHLVSKSQHRFKTWVLLTHVDGEELEVDMVAIERIRRKLQADARYAYDRLLSEDPHVRPVSELVRDFNAHVHPGVFGLLERAGIPASLEDILGNAVRDALKTAGGDPEKALKLLRLREKFWPLEAGRPKQGEESKPFGAGLVEGELLDRYSQIVHAAAHHLYDVSEYLFGKSAPAELAKVGMEWHKHSLNEFELLQTD